MIGENVDLGQPIGQALDELYLVADRFKDPAKSDDVYFSVAAEAMFDPAILRHSLPILEEGLGRRTLNYYLADSDLDGQPLFVLWTSLVNLGIWRNDHDFPNESYLDVDTYANAAYKVLTSGLSREALVDDLGTRTISFTEKQRYWANLVLMHLLKDRLGESIGFIDVGGGTGDGAVHIAQEKGFDPVVILPNGDGDIAAETEARGNPSSIANRLNELAATPVKIKPSLSVDPVDPFDRSSWEFAMLCKRPEDLVAHDFGTYEDFVSQRTGNLRYWNGLLSMSGLVNRRPGTQPDIEGFSYEATIQNTNRYQLPRDVRYAAATILRQYLTDPAKGGKAQGVQMISDFVATRGSRLRDRTDWRTPYSYRTFLIGLDGDYTRPLEIFRHKSSLCRVTMLGKDFERLRQAAA